MKHRIKRIKKDKVPYNGIYKGLKTDGIRSENFLICKTGKKNVYRIAFYKGLGGSMTESTWNTDLHHHDCCKSAVAWRHRTICPGLNSAQDEKIIVNETKEELIKMYFG